MGWDGLGRGERGDLVWFSGWGGRGFSVVVVFSWWVGKEGEGGGGGGVR